MAGIAAEPLHEMPAELAVGDWVFRMGTSLESHLIASFVDSEFSHIGVVVQVEPEVLILHATTEDLQPLNNQVLLSSWQHFVDKRLARRVAVARPGFLESSEQQRISQVLLERVGQPFRLVAREYQPVYCTTILAEAIQLEHPAFAPDWQYLKQPLLKGEYLHPQAFANYYPLEWILR